VEFKYSSDRISSSTQLNKHYLLKCLFSPSLSTSYQVCQSSQNFSTSSMPVTTRSRSGGVSVSSQSQAGKQKKSSIPKKQKSYPAVLIDVNTHCAVPLALGKACAAGLWCTRHSWSKKHAVPGRSMPFDMLLAAGEESNGA